MSKQRQTRQSTKGRTLTLRARADRMEETRRRIVQAAYELHASIGPSRTTISAIAARAGVQRLTVYHHFPDEVALARACTSFGLAADPVPDPSQWSAIADPEARLRFALSQVYAYFRRNETLWANVLRDAQLMPVEIASQVRELTQPFFDLPVRGRDVLAVGWRARDQRELLLAALGMALEFQVWRALTRQGLDDERVIAFTVGTIRARGEVAARSVGGSEASRDTG